jgi:AraC-like DNA-binding protein
MSELVQVIFYGGALQGFLLAVFLFSIRTNKISNRLLGILTTFWGVVLLVFALQAKGLYLKYPHLLYVFDQLILCFFPLLFLQVKYLLTHHKVFEKKDLLHFVPFLAGIVLYMDFFIRPVEEKLALQGNPTAYYQIVEIILHEIISLQGIVYSILAILLIKKYQKKITDFVSTLHKSIIKVLYIGISLNLLSWTLGIIDVHLRYFDITLGVDLFAITYLILVLVIYVISYAALKSPEVFKLEMEFEPRGKIVLREPGEVASAVAGTYKNAEAHADDKPQLTRLNDQLVTFIEKEKPYLNPELSLPALADSLDTSRNQLSEVINKVHNKNFYEFINGYRVQEVKSLMADPKNKHLKLMSLAYDAGFNSKATFNRIFKQMTGMTPSEFLAEQQEKSADQ